jgi:hypothetical protein
MNRKRNFIILLTIVLILAAGVRSVVLGAASPPKWEYTVMQDIYTEADGRYGALNAKGYDGWELVAVTTKQNVTLCYFKRPKP